MFAIVRDLPSTFVNCVTAVDNSQDPINLELAKKQHDDYVDTIKQHVEHVIEVQTDEAHPGITCYLLIALFSNMIHIRLLLCRR